MGYSRVGRAEIDANGAIEDILGRHFAAKNRERVGRRLVEGRKT
jgi:hypothetical protein